MEENQTTAPEEQKEQPGAIQGDWRVAPRHGDPADRGF